MEMRYSKWIRFGTFVVFGFLQALSVHATEPSVGQCLSGALQQRLVKAVGPRSYYQPILSTDLDFLRNEARFAEGPAPQRNVAIVAPTHQFRFNGETQAILELKKRLMTRTPNRTIGGRRGPGAETLRAVREPFHMMLAEFPETAPHVFRREG